MRSTQAARTVQGLQAFFSTPGAAARDAEALRARAEARALELFQTAARDVPAYRAFLQHHGVEPGAVRDMAAFRALPATTKDNYYRQYPLPELCRHGQLDACDMVALSTGSTGEPAVWPRFITDELATAARFEQVLRDGFAAGQRRTLAVICFALGNWVGGMYTLACCRQLAAKGYPITVVSPGNQPAPTSSHSDVRVRYSSAPVFEMKFS